VPTFTRSLSQLAGLRSVAARRMALALVSTATMLVALLLGAVPAGALITETPVTHFDFGLQQRTVPTIERAPLQYHGGQVLHSSDSYAIYWDPTGIYRGDWQRLIDKYFQSVGNESGSLGDVFSVAMPPINRPSVVATPIRIPIPSPKIAPRNMLKTGKRKKNLPV
jgi:hypothetical protein